jgi:hypothetical protein
MTNTNEENKMMKKTSQEIEIARNVANANKFANRAARIAAWKVSNKKN